MLEKRNRQSHYNNINNTLGELSVVSERSHQQVEPSAGPFFVHLNEALTDVKYLQAMLRQYTATRRDDTYSETQCATTCMQELTHLDSSTLNGYPLFPSVFNLMARSESLLCLCFGVNECQVCISPCQWVTPQHVYKGCDSHVNKCRSRQANSNNKNSASPVEKVGKGSRFKH